MSIDECFLLGYVIKRHALKGEVSILLDVDDPLTYSELESVFIELDGKLVPFFVDKINIKGDKAVVQFEDINTLEAAEELKGSKLYLPLTLLPQLGGTSFYYHEVIGFTLKDLQAGQIGIKKDIYTGSGQELLAVTYKGNEILIPISDQILHAVDRDLKEMTVAIPDGLLEIYD